MTSFIAFKELFLYSTVQQVVKLELALRYDKVSLEKI